MRRHADIDWNGDGDYVDADDETDLTELTSSFAAQDDGTVTVNVRVRDDESNVATAQTSATWLKVNVAPDTPTLHAPPNGADLTGTPATLEVEITSDDDGDALFYEFQIDESPLFLSSFLQESGPVAQGVGITSWSPPVPLVENATYFWRVRATDGDLASDWQAGTFVRDAQEEPPGIPRNLVPADGSLVVDTPILLIANAVDPDDDAVTYDFEVLRDGETVASLTGVVPGLDGHTPGLLTDELARGRTYSWRARAVDATVAGDWSAPTSFQVYDEPSGGGGCGCSLAPRAPSGAPGLALLALLALAVRRKFASL